MPDAPRVLEELRVGAEEAPVDEVVALDAREGVGELVLRHAPLHVGVDEEPAGGALPHAPRDGGAAARLGVVAGEPRVVGEEEVTALGLGDGREVVLPRVGEDRARAALVEPVDLLLAEEEDAAQHELGDALGVGLGVGQREGRPPGAAEDHPAVDAEVGAEALDVGDERPGGVVVEARVRRALPAPALVELDDAVALGVEEPPVLRVAPAAGAAVEEHHRPPVGVARLLPVEVVDGGHAQPPRSPRGDLRVQTVSTTSHCRHGRHRSHGGRRTVNRYRARRPVATSDTATQSSPPRHGAARQKRRTGGASRAPATSSVTKARAGSRGSRGERDPDVPEGRAREGRRAAPRGHPRAAPAEEERVGLRSNEVPERDGGRALGAPDPQRFQRGEAHQRAERRDEGAARAGGGERAHPEGRDGDEREGEGEGVAGLAGDVLGPVGHERVGGEEREEGGDGATAQRARAEHDEGAPGEAAQPPRGRSVDAEGEAERAGHRGEATGVAGLGPRAAAPLAEVPRGLRGEGGAVAREAPRRAEEPRAPERAHRAEQANGRDERAGGRAPRDEGREGAGGDEHGEARPGAEREGREGGGEGAVARGDGAVADREREGGEAEAERVGASLRGDVREDG